MSLQESNQPTKADLKLIQFLNEYLPFINHYTPTFINQGGCGYFAYFLSRVLDKMNVSNQIVFLVPKEGFALAPDGSEDPEFKFQRKSLKEHLENGTPFPLHFVPIHCFVKLDENICVDSLGIANGQVNEIDLYEIPRATVFDLVRDRSRWNPIFDINCLGQIEIMLNELPFEYGKWLQGQRYLPDKPGAVNEHTIEMRHRQSAQQMFAGIFGRMNQELDRNLEDESSES